MSAAGGPGSSPAHPTHTTHTHTTHSTHPNPSPSPPSPLPSPLQGALARLPRPSLTFTVPSLHDGLPVDCRVYHPRSLAASPDAPPWQKHAAIVAHPYAPLGGCYDDPIVDLVAGTLLGLGFLVGTFNFRGAHGSAGRTSWTARAERADYMSVVGFVSHYAHFLDPFKQPTPNSPGTTTHLDRVAESTEELTSAIHIRPPTPTSPHPSPSAPSPVLVMGGYSYGSMITCQLPSLENVLALFHAPACGSHAAEIRLRAEHLAEMQNTVLASARAAAVDRLHPTAPRKHLGVRVGGDEESRKSHESRRSLSAEFEEGIRHGVAELMARTRRGHRRSQSGRGHSPRDSHGAAGPPEIPSDHLPPITDLVTSRPAYLLISPLQGVITNLATMSLPSFMSIPGKNWIRSSFAGGGRPATAPAPSKEAPEPAALARHVPAEAEDKLVRNPTLAIYGDRDGFVPVRKLRDWAARLESVHGSRFRAHEVSSANHFWVQRNVASIMCEAVGTFAGTLLEDAAG